VKRHKVEGQVRSFFQGSRPFEMGNHLSVPLVETGVTGHEEDERRTVNVKTAVGTFRRKTGVRVSQVSHLAKKAWRSKSWRQ